ncbi:ficolin-2-like [Physella acuta]|uniref:ficolin-2-like n=1 Tax=Physella acuta TaxID=109671 RepID=UPI0027DBE4EC|nr:ficolin-2-like [Physella acuta]
MVPSMSDCKGTWIPTIRFCQCNSGYIGENCDTLGKSCRDLVGSYKVNTRVGSYLRSTFTNASYLTNCAIMDTGEIRTDFANFRVTVPFYVNRTWEEYVAGFSYNVGYLTPNIYDLWVGLDNMYYLYSVSRKPARMNVHLYFGGDTLGYVFIYYNINITDSSNNYKFSYGSFATNKFPALSFPPVNATNFTNCFSSKTTPGFSAPGRDNDDDPVNDCAKQSQGGWWISSCNVEPDCNPFGVPYNSSSDPITLERTRFKNSNIRDYVQYFSVIRIYLIESP